jgi:hypothetical protein
MGWVGIRWIFQPTTRLNALRWAGIIFEEKI